MPNWCENSVQIIGKAEDVAGFVRGLKGKRQNLKTHIILMIRIVF